MKQMVLLPELTQKVVHGGESWLGQRKGRRPLSTKKAIHVTIRSSLAKGPWSFLHPNHAAFVRALISSTAARFGVIVYEQSNVGNHLHLLVRTRTCDGLKRFLMVLTGRIAQRITGAKKGKPFGKRFFDFIPHTRIIEWGRAFRIAKAYVRKNTLEALGLIPHTARCASNRKDPTHQCSKLPRHPIPKA